MLKDMKTYAHLKPGQKGTHRLVEKYGDSLVCVRYRHDETHAPDAKPDTSLGHQPSAVFAPKYLDFHGGMLY